jgi:polyisoprenoid-binding protein YceI
MAIRAWLAFLCAGCLEPEQVVVRPATDVLFLAQSLDAPPPAGQTTFRLLPEKSWIYVVVYNDPAGMASGLGHDHGIKAMSFDGSVVWDWADPTKCIVNISFPVATLRPDPPGMRERAKLDPEGSVSPAKLDTIRENFLSKSQLDAETYKTISYTGRSCTGPGTAHVTGALTVRGVTKNIVVPMNITVTPSSFAARGTFVAKGTDFGFKPFTNLGGALRNKDEMTFVIDVEGVPAG